MVQIGPLLRKLWPFNIANVSPQPPSPYPSRNSQNFLHMNIWCYTVLKRLQSAYKDGHSIKTALVRVHNDLLTAMDWLLIELDLSAAFNTLDHNMLLQRLNTRCGVECVPGGLRAILLTELSQLSSMGPNLRNITCPVVSCKAQS